MAEIVKRVNNAKKSINSIKKKIQQLKINIPYSLIPIARSSDKTLYDEMIKAITILRRVQSPRHAENRVDWRVMLWHLHSVFTTSQSPSQIVRILDLKSSAIRKIQEDITRLMNEAGNASLNSTVNLENRPGERDHRYTNRRNFVLNIFDLIQETIKLRALPPGDVFGYFRNQKHTTLPFTRETIMTPSTFLDRWN